MSLNIIHSTPIRSPSPSVTAPTPDPARHHVPECHPLDPGPPPAHSVVVVEVVIRVATVAVVPTMNVASEATMAVTRVMVATMTSLGGRGCGSSRCRHSEEAANSRGVVVVGLEEAVAQRLDRTGAGAAGGPGCGGAGRARLQEERQAGTWA
jgi:hypothetical protein